MVINHLKLNFHAQANSERPSETERERERRKTDSIKDTQVASKPRRNLILMQWFLLLDGVTNVAYLCLQFRVHIHTHTNKKKVDLLGGVHMLRATRWNQVKDIFIGLVKKKSWCFFLPLRFLIKFHERLYLFIVSRPRSLDSNYSNSLTCMRSI